MTTVQFVERLVPEGVRVRPVAGGFILSDGQWTTHLATDDLANGDAAAESTLSDRVAQAVSTLRSARHDDEHAREASRGAA